jgi:very-short-patch-repair endonuclease
MKPVIQADLAKSFSLASQQNAYPLVKRILLSMPAQDEGEASDTRSSIREIGVRLTTEPELISPEEWLIDRLDEGQSTKLQERHLRPQHDKLVSLTEEIAVKITIVVSYINQNGFSGELRSEHDVMVLPADYWGGESRQPELLAAFVQPNTHTVETLTAKVTHILRASNEPSQVDGYQSNTRERPYLFGSALWSLMFNERFTYLSPPQGWANQGQRIRSAADIMQYKTAACLDTSVLFASCLENMGLNPVIALTKEHALVGFWLIDESFPVLTNDDPIDLRKRVDSSDLVMFETTLVTNDSPITFRQSIERAKELLSEDRESQFVMLIDIKHARSRKIRPLSTIEEKPSKPVTGNDDGVVIGLGTVPTLPPVRSEERIIEETPETRVDSWQRKLLDLTKRNPLLNVKTSALKLYCPDLGELEDQLAAGEKFNFMAAEDTGLNDPERSAETFLLMTGNSQHREYALDQLGRRRLVVNDTKKRLETKLIELLRKAKNDLEEGGSNTLYLAIGMLRWRETPDSEKSFRAPLILLPVKLERRSANAPITMRQLPDEDPLFNLTLIEMLQTDYDINLDELRNDLPEDESGVDVEGIWKIVREAIKEQKGFIVAEEIVLGSFSFAKYLMWKDLRDREDLLKRSPFVEHLVDRPADAYYQESSFISKEDIDQKISPAEFYAPLNCDASQTVAVAASAVAQDFVLEGPPGTGKSETIANIICHNLAIGRKVLFVAEKMAALQVVYRRMEKVGLAHLCLELHSNKANKKSVLDQLNAAWTRREAASQSDWLKRAQNLEELRSHLNRYVADLHHKHSIGFSPRDAMARIVRYQHQHPLRVSWPTDLQQAPIKSEAELDPLLETAKEMGIAFAEVAELDPATFAAIEQTDWTNSWRSTAVELANKLSIAAEQASKATADLLKTLGIEIEILSIDTVVGLSALAELCDIALKGNVDYALNTGGSSRVQSLERTVPLQTELFDAIEAFGHGLKWTMLNDLDWEDWIAKRDEATGLFGFLKRYSLGKEMRQKGLNKIEDLSILETAIKARSILDALTLASKDVSDSQAWEGVDTDPSSVKLSLEQGQRALELFSRCLSLFPDPTIAAPILRRHLVEGREFLANSQLVVQSQAVESAQRALAELINQAMAARIGVDTKDPLTKVSADFGVIAESSEKLSRWCRWLGMKKQGSQFDIDALSHALESRIIQPHECEQNLLTALCFWIAPILIDQSEALVRFSSASHESTIEKFRELDADVAVTAAEYIVAKTAGAVPDRLANDTPAEYGVLSRELQKKSRHKPVRALVTEMGSSMTNLTPCFMMSPLSVAQFLPADFSLFDLVVFDEASQITTWDAVGAIARGKNVIVVGDPKQMPPSNNFGRKDDDDSDEGDLESILDQALAARLPHLRLTGHYRSRHETLIAFSNSHYYENALTTFPSAETKRSAVKLHRVDGVYAKGRGQTNAIEAQAAVNEVVRRLEGMLSGDPVLSLGIVAINSQQQRIVEDFLDEARRKNVELEKFFTATDDYDPIFVKNLESVQGDERDIIVLSLTYGPTEKGGKTMGMNFGPLNKQGGERRLNVAVTRATSEVLVFSSFDSSMVDLSRTQATAVAHLKNYLEFAERGPIALAEYSTANYGIDHFDSDFEQAVAMSLRQKGWKVQTQVGVSKFKVDMGIVHPDHPGEYLAGIECDGATYHGSPCARDRDRVRQAILENLGWRIIRLWSTDYFKDPDYAMRKMLERLDEVLAEDRAQRIAKQETAEQTHEVAEETAANVSELDVSSQGSPNDGADADDHTVEVESLADGVLASLPAYGRDRYFKDDHRMNLSRLAKSVLELKNGITLHELALDIAHLHGLTRTSKSQHKHLLSVIESWVGILRHRDRKPVVWLSPDDICEEIPWRGYTAFGVERTWAELCYQEQLGVARAALAAQPNDPIDWLFKEFQMSRRSASTIETFTQWIERVR